MSGTKVYQFTADDFVEGIATFPELVKENRFRAWVSLQKRKNPNFDENSITFAELSDWISYAITNYYGTRHNWARMIGYNQKTASSILNKRLPVTPKFIRANGFAVISGHDVASYRFGRILRRKANGKNEG